eukprot:scaffold40_cov19-Tisochrysis_lutea.AAC.1
MALGAAVRRVRNDRTMARHRPRRFVNRSFRRARSTHSRDGVQNTLHSMSKSQECKLKRFLF